MRDVKLIEPVQTDSTFQEESSVRDRKMKNSTMVRRVRLARRRQFKARRMRECRGVFVWKQATPQVMRHLLALVQCTSVLADVPLIRRSELRAKLAAALARGDKEKAFAKTCGFSDKPLANDPAGLSEFGRH